MSDDIETACQRLEEACMGHAYGPYPIKGKRVTDIRTVIAAARRAMERDGQMNEVQGLLTAERQAYAVLHAWSDQSIAREKNLEAERDALKAKAERLEARVALLEGECGVLEANLFALEHSLTKARVTELESALERTLANFEAVLAQRPVRDATETIAEARAALGEKP